MSELWALITLVAVTAACLGSLVLLAGTVDLGVLPLHKRRRVEYCRSHFRLLEGVCGALLAVLVAAQVVALL